MIAVLVDLAESKQSALGSSVDESGPWLVTIRPRCGSAAGPVAMSAGPTVQACKKAPQQGSPSEENW